MDPMYAMLAFNAVLFSVALVVSLISYLAHRNEQKMFKSQGRIYQVSYIQHLRESDDMLDFFAIVSIAYMFIVVLCVTVFSTIISGMYFIKL